VLKPDAVRDTLSLLHSCGFYEYSGAFAFKVSLSSSIDKSKSQLVLPNNRNFGPLKGLSHEIDFDNVG
jgi:glutaminase